MRKSTLFFWIYIVILVVSFNVVNAQQLNFVLRSTQDVTVEDNRFMAVGWDDKSTFIPAPPAPPGNNFYMYIAGTFRFKDIKVYSAGTEYQWNFEFNLPRNAQTHTLYLNNEHNASATDYVLLLDENGSVLENLTTATELNLTEDMNGRFSLKMLPKGSLDTPIRLVEAFETKEMGNEKHEVLKFNRLFASPNIQETTFTFSEITNSNIFYTIKENQVTIDWTSTQADLVEFKIDASNQFGSENLIISYKRTVLTNIDDNNELANTIGLSQNYPNPFNPATTIRYNLPQAMKINLSVYNMAGQQVAMLVNGVQSSGQNTVQFNASALPSGVYIYRLATAETVLAKKMTLVK